MSCLLHSGFPISIYSMSSLLFMKSKPKIALLFHWLFVKKFAKYPRSLSLISFGPFCALGFFCVGFFFLQYAFEKLKLPYRTKAIFILSSGYVNVVS